MHGFNGEHQQNAQEIEENEERHAQPFTTREHGRSANSARAHPRSIGEYQNFESIHIANILVNERGIPLRGASECAAPSPVMQTHTAAAQHRTA